MGHKVRVAFYGAGNFANTTHIPNLLLIKDTQIVAICDINQEAATSTADKFQIPQVFFDGQEMLDQVEFDALYSIVPAYARTDVEMTAAKRGIHLFSEKPQALKIQLARNIDEAIQESGVISTVGFRERYRPIFQKAKSFLSDKQIVHTQFSSYGGLPRLRQQDEGDSWHSSYEKGGFSAFDWGCHAVDYMRFMTGLDIVATQAFYHTDDRYQTPLSCSFHYLFASGATMTSTFISATPTSPPDVPRFRLFYEGGYLSVHGYERIEVNQEIIYTATDYDPWLAQDRAFIAAVKTNDQQLLMSDYSDGIYSLAPVLAGWESARQDGETIDLAEFLAGNE